MAELANATGLGPVGRKPLEVRVLSPALALAVLLSGTAASASLRPSSGWQNAKPLPQARTEVASARLGSEIAVIGGFLADGTSTGRVDAYSPRTGRWLRLPDLPAKVNHGPGWRTCGRRGHGLAVAGFGSRVYAIAGGPQPGLHVSAANEFLNLR